MWEGVKCGCFALLWASCFVLVVAAQPLTQPQVVEKLVAYNVVMHTFWTRDRFPKHYPDWSPTAQFSQLIGESHDNSRYIYRVGRSVRSEVKNFAETGQWEGWTKEGLLDEFTAPPINSGQGRTEAQFFLDSNHSLVSLMSRIIPSPDWFVGLDSFQLCVDGNWLDTITIEVDPMDAGTDNGFTFTAPKWVTEPQGVVYRITSHFPAHPAGSFYYPYIKRLPPIATFQFIKLREYEVSEVFQHGEDEKKYEVVKSDQKNRISVMEGNEDIQQEIEEETKEEELLKREQLSTLDNSIYPLSTQKPGSAQMVYGSHINNLRDTEDVLNSISQTYHGPHNFRSKMRKSKYGRDCRVGDWGSWGPCSVSCGVGEMSRHRSIVKEARHGGHPCPPLKQTRWCGTPASNCSTELNHDW